jgi:hypothetical protein
MKMIFVAGPYRAGSEWEVFQNIRRAESLALELWRMGLAVVCPHKNTEWFGGAASDQVWLEGAQEMVRRSDAIVCTSDWESSAGARGEVALAHKLGIPVFHHLNEVQTWLQSQE